MATRTAVIHVGVGHPNDDGLIDPPGPEAWWLIEGARCIWFREIRKSGEKRRAVLPRSPSSALQDGLSAVLLSGLDQAELARLPEKAVAMLSEKNTDLANLNDTEYAGLREAAIDRSTSFGGKMIISAFSGSAVLYQFDVLRAFSVDMEVLSPTGTRLWNRWRQETLETGFFSEP